MFSLLNKFDLKQVKQELHSVSPKCPAICIVISAKFCYGCQDWQWKEQGNAEFGFGASPAGAGEESPADYQHSNCLLPPLVCP